MAFPQNSKSFETEIANLNWDFNGWYGTPSKKKKNYIKIAAPQSCIILKNVVYSPVLSSTIYSMKKCVAEFNKFVLVFFMMKGNNYQIKSKLLLMN